MPPIRAATRRIRPNREYRLPTDVLRGNGPDAQPPDPGARNEEKCSRRADVFQRRCVVRSANASVLGTRAAGSNTCVVRSANASVPGPRAAGSNATTPIRRHWESEATPCELTAPIMRSTGSTTGRQSRGLGRSPTGRSISVLRSAAILAASCSVGRPKCGPPVSCQERYGTCQARKTARSRRTQSRSPQRVPSIVIPLIGNSPHSAATFLALHTRLEAWDVNVDGA
jgi:hypothetical protein